MIGAAVAFRAYELMEERAQKAYKKIQKAKQDESEIRFIISLGWDNYEQWKCYSERVRGIHQRLGAVRERKAGTSGSKGRQRNLDSKGYGERSY